jgi:hypothetical protein
MNRVADEKHFVDGGTKLALGDEFNPSHTGYVGKETIQNRTKDYNSRDALNEVATRAEGRNVEVLEGGHEELVVVFNYKRGYTIDRDAFVKDTDKQVFVVDMWYIDELADTMAVGPEAVEMRERLRHAMVAFQIATYLELCDGSHRPVILKPQEQESNEPALATR